MKANGNGFHPRRFWRKAHNDLVRDHSLSRDARLLFLVIKSYASFDGSNATPNREMLVRDMDCSENSLDKWANELQKAGKLSITKRRINGEWASSSYTLND